MTAHRVDLGEDLVTEEGPAPVRLVAIGDGSVCDCGYEAGICPKCGREWRLVHVVGGHAFFEPTGDVK